MARQSNASKTNTAKTNTTTKTTEIKEFETNKAVEVEKSKLTQKIIKIPLEYTIPVRSGVEGKLVWKSKKNGYSIRWDNYGCVEYLTYQDIVAMRNGNKLFFVNNYIYFEDTEDYTAEEIYKSLQVDKYYKEIFDEEMLDNILNLSVDELKKRLVELPNNVKSVIATKAKVAIEENNPVMDSIAKRDIIEEVCDVQLIIKDI